MTGQTTEVFKKQGKEEWSDKSFSILYARKGATTTLDVVCLDNLSVWITGLSYLINGPPPARLIAERAAKLEASSGAASLAHSSAESVPEALAAQVSNISRHLQKKKLFGASFGDCDPFCLGTSTRTCCCGCWGAV